MRVVQVAASALLTLAAAAVTACPIEYKNGPPPPEPADPEVRVIGAFPAVDDGSGTLVRQCGAGPVDGFIVDVAVLSSPRSGDADRSLRPDDLSSPLGTDSFGLEVDCIDPWPDADGSLVCQGPSAAAQLDAVAYRAHTDSADVAHNVVVVIDMSGSTKGFVNETTGKEDIPGGRTSFPANLQSAASDYPGLRFAAVRDVVSDLNESDLVGIVAFGEGLEDGPLFTACAAVAGLSWDQALDVCLNSTKKDPWLAGINNLQGRERPGRSNLWEAVAAAHGYLRGRGGTRSNHVLIVSDGPDTCQEGVDYGACQQPCPSQVSFGDVIDQVGEASGPPVHVHAVQFESEGYPGPDPRQMEVACRTGGTYQFINSIGLARVNIDAFNLALELAVGNVRQALMGHWQLSARSEAFARDAAGTDGTPPGGVYKLGGTVTLRSASDLTDEDVTTPLVGIGAGQWDQRLTLRKACATAADCGDTDPGDGCSVICSPETLTCMDTDLPDGVSCPGGDGVCCGGSCQTECADCGR